MSQYKFKKYELVFVSSRNEIGEYIEPWNEYHLVRFNKNDGLNEEVFVAIYEDIHPIDRNKPDDLIEGYK